MNPKAVLFSYEESPTGLVFRISEGQFSGVEYQYGTVSIQEPDGMDTDEAVLHFTYQLVDDPTGTAETEDNIVDLRIAMGDILYEIIMGNEVEL